MKKLMMILALTLSYLAVANTALNADSPPDCNPCPWVR